ncbi:Multidrug resistance-associated protein 4 [Stylophora pistillata]|uniref:Multidrug resistance-associated protein 4 n=1 Tax=Stylophora pistillata TaxID=50429 RepID=A0A2B4RFL2_STYPI|nr:Multidrug resistance-associated protein 4 [Stylophora pistillata]
MTVKLITYKRRKSSSDKTHQVITQNSIAQSAPEAFLDNTAHLPKKVPVCLANHGSVGRHQRNASYLKKPCLSISKVSCPWNQEDLRNTLSGITEDIMGNQILAIIGEVKYQDENTQAFIMVVIIDGSDLASINLQDARRSMAVITQAPVVFAGTLRRNLDPFKEHTDAVRWKEMENVQWKTLVEDLSGQLEFKLKESGANFSIGGRQLISLALALVQKSKIIIMDEATVNVDFRTDRLI